MKAGKQCIEFETGRVEMAANGSVGIDIDGNATQGWQGPLTHQPLTAEERAELAREMIARWKKFGGIK